MTVLTRFAAAAPLLLQLFSTSQAAAQPGIPQTGVPQPGVPMPVVEGVPPPPVYMSDPTQIETTTDTLQAAMQQLVPHMLRLTQARKQQIVDLVAQSLQTHNMAVNHAQLLLAVDRNPRAQIIAVMLARPDAPWRILGVTHVSTGQANRKLYYITPTGVFPHDGAILDYRAEGTFNENHIRGLGLKGMRVWDFGWQWASKGWLTSGEQGQIRLEMHATDPEFLEQRLGKPASEGCVRIPATLNHFLDHYGVLDADYEQQAMTDRRFASVLAPNRDPSPLAGNLLVVVDSSAGSL